MQTENRYNREAFNDIPTKREQEGEPLMNGQERSHELTATTIALGLLLTAGAAFAAPPPQTAAADLRDMAGQTIVGEDGLVWKYVEAIVEWGFQKGTEDLPFDGSIQSTHVLGVLGTARPLPGDKQTTMTGPLAWKSPAGGGARRGIVLPVLYTPAVRGPARTILTVRTASGSFSFHPALSNLKCNTRNAAYSVHFRPMPTQGVPSHEDACRDSIASARELRAKTLHLRFDSASGGLGNGADPGAGLRVLR
ncbi:MAG: hypothetical protein FJ225_13815, partial [Lentisphaerae bacterium]|nr:hypothetical protein [Lentisphaerota bacterium]